MKVIIKEKLLNEITQIEDMIIDAFLKLQSAVNDNEGINYFLGEENISNLKNEIIELVDRGKGVLISIKKLKEIAEKNNDIVNLDEIKRKYEEGKEDTLTIVEKMSIYFSPQNLI